MMPPPPLRPSRPNSVVGFVDGLFANIMASSPDVKLHTPVTPNTPDVPQDSSTQNLPELPDSPALSENVTTNKRLSTIDENMGSEQKMVFRPRGVREGRFVEHDDDEHTSGADVMAFLAQDVAKHEASLANGGNLYIDNYTVADSVAENLNKPVSNKNRKKYVKKRAAKAKKARPANLEVDTEVANELYVPNKCVTSAESKRPHSHMDGRLENTLRTARQEFDATVPMISQKKSRHSYSTPQRLLSAFKRSEKSVQGLGAFEDTVSMYEDEMSFSSTCEIGTAMAQRLTVVDKGAITQESLEREKDIAVEASGFSYEETTKKENKRFGVIGESPFGRHPLDYYRDAELASQGDNSIPNPRKRAPLGDIGNSPYSQEELSNAGGSDEDFRNPRESAYSFDTSKSVEQFAARRPDEAAASGYSMRHRSMASPPQKSPFENRLGSRRSAKISHNIDVAQDLHHKKSYVSYATAQSNEAGWDVLGDAARAEDLVDLPQPPARHASTARSGKLTKVGSDDKMKKSKSIFSKKEKSLREEIPDDSEFIAIEFSGVFFKVPEVEYDDDLRSEKQKKEDFKQFGAVESFDVNLCGTIITLSNHQYCLIMRGMHKAKREVAAAERKTIRGRKHLSKDEGDFGEVDEQDKIPVNPRYKMVKDQETGRLAMQQKGASDSIDNLMIPLRETLAKAANKKSPFGKIKEALKEVASGYSAV